MAETQMLSRQKCARSTMFTREVMAGGRWLCARDVD